MSSTIFHQLQKQRYRITLDITAMGDFNPRDIDWNKLFELEGNEHCDAYIEDLNSVDSW
jgi:hypothetical protein